jgi:ERCC4-type nuclease
MKDRKNYINNLFNARKTVNKVFTNGSYHELKDIMKDGGEKVIEL